MKRVPSRPSPSVLRRAAMCTRSAASSTVVSGQTRAMRSSRLMMRPGSSTTMIRMSIARLPRRTDLSPSDKRRCAGSNRNGPNKIVRMNDRSSGSVTSRPHIHSPCVAYGESSCAVQSGLRGTGSAPKVSRMQRIKLGLSMRYLGYHAAAWRHPQADPGAASKFQHFVRVAQTAEAAKFDMLFLADGIGIPARVDPPGSLCRSAQNAELEPLTLLSALAAVTRRIGLVATASTTYNEPFHVARKYASLDHISGGRAGWNIVTSWSEEEARNFNRDTHLDYDTRYERAEEFVRVVTGLWDSWEGEAFPRDKARGLYYVPDKLHVLDHQGKHFKVRGP